MYDVGECNFLGILKSIPRVNEIKTKISAQVSDQKPRASIAERKGVAHPDSLCDEIAIKMSSQFSKFCIGKLGFVLNHNFDKFGLMGGETRVSFGGGEVVSPIRAILNGRAAKTYCEEAIPTVELMKHGVESILKKRIPEYFHHGGAIRFLEEIGLGPSPGQVFGGGVKLERANWFRPDQKTPPKYMNGLVANDTSMGSATWPPSEAASLALEIESDLFSGLFSKDGCYGLDTKLMVCISAPIANVTACIPQLSRFINNKEKYRQNLKCCKSVIEKSIGRRRPDLTPSVVVNARDDIDRNLCYLTLSGSSIESGDEGLVGRGNRLNGVIDPLSCQNMEGFAGKNPVYHVGLIYNVLALRLAKELSSMIGGRVSVIMTSSTGQSLYTPRDVIVDSREHIPLDEIKMKLNVHLESLPSIIMDMVNGKVLEHYD